MILAHFTFNSHLPFINVAAADKCKLANAKLLVNDKWQMVNESSGGNDL